MLPNYWKIPNRNVQTFGFVYHDTNGQNIWRPSCCVRCSVHRRSRNGQLKNQTSIMLEDYEESISLTLRTRSSKKPLGMLQRNWKHQWLPLCLARHARKARKRRSVATLMISSQNLRVSWKPVNPQECAWKNLYKLSWGPYCREGGQFTAKWQFGAHICSYTSSN